MASDRGSLKVTANLDVTPDYMCSNMNGKIEFDLPLNDVPPFSESDCIYYNAKLVDIDLTIMNVMECFATDDGFATQFSPSDIHPIVSSHTGIKDIYHITVFLNTRNTENSCFFLTNISGKVELLCNGWREGPVRHKNSKKYFWWSNLGRL